MGIPAIPPSFPAAQFKAVNTALGLKLDKTNAPPAWKSNEVPVVFLMGQSNADGRAYQADVPNLSGVTWSGQVRIYNKSITRSPSSASVNRVDNGAWANFDYSTNMVVSPPGANSMGVETPLAVDWVRNYYAAAGNKPLYVIKCAIGGVPLAAAGGGADTDWSSASGQIWDLAYNWVVRPALRKLILQGLTPRCVGFVWMQGENDAQVLAQANAYEANLRDLITNRIRGQLGFPAARVLVAGLSNYAQPDPTIWQTVKNAQIAVAQGKNALSNVVLLPTDGSNGQSPANRYLSGVGPGDIHYNAVGQCSIAANILNNLDFPGAPYTKIYDLEMVAPRLLLGQAPSTSDIVYDPTIPGGVVTTGSLPSTSGNMQSLSWFSDPSVTAKPDNNANGYFATPTTKFRLMPLDGANDVEVIFQMAHDGDANTKPGVLLRATERAWVGGGILASNDGIGQSYLFQVRGGGSELKIYKASSGAYAVLSDVFPPVGQYPAAGALYWYKVTMIGSALTIYNSPDGVAWTQQISVTDTSFATGNTYFHLFNGGLSVNAPYAAHCHFPALFARKL